MSLSRLRVLAMAVVPLAIVTTATATATAASASAAPASHYQRTVSSPATSRAPGHVKAPVTGKFRTAAGTGTFKGKFKPKSFRVVRGKLRATGVLTGTMVNAHGQTLGQVHRTITTTVNTAASNDAAGCNVLNLVLGPLHLNLLGLVVHLNTVHLTITAVPGVGNLLGNLLCDIASLLNSGGSLSQISALLNQVLALL
jgi:hypothetical protein